MSTQTKTANLHQLYDVLASTKLFGGLAQDIISEIIHSSEVITLGPGMDLFRPGDSYQGKVYILLQGDLVQRFTGGHENRPQSGDLIGLANYIDQANYTSHVRSITRCELLAVDSVKLQSAEEKYPKLFNTIQSFIAQKLRSIRTERGVSGVFAQPVSLYMKQPLAHCSPHHSLREAFQIMDEQHIGSLVVIDDKEKLVGVLTYHGLAKATLIGNSSDSEQVTKVACEKPQTVTPETPLWRAENKLKKHGLKYLIVCENGKAVGMVSQTDILRALTSHPGLLTTQIPEAKSIEELGSQFQQMPNVATEAREGHHSPSDAVRVISETHLAIQRRVIELTLQEMSEPPPAAFAFLIMGSGGRREMLLNPDQDNGLILGDDATDDFLPWFESFSNRINENLDRVGYPLCPGEIMARNHLYRKRLSEWKQQIDYITKRPTEKAARWSNIVFDFDTLYGDESLTSSLRRHVLKAISERPHLLNLMTDHDAEGKPAIGLFKRLRTTHSDQGDIIDIKRNGLRIIADAARIFALQQGIAVRSTPDRLNALVHLGKFSSDFVTAVNEAYEELLDILLEHQIEQAKAKTEPDKYINPDTLTDQGRSVLQMAMRSVKRLQDALQSEFGTELF